MHRPLFVLALAAFLLRSGSARAAEPLKPLAVKPGLWETTLTLKTSGPPPAMQEALAKMSPEQRAKVEAAFPREPKKMVSKACITKEDLEKPFDFGEEEEDCHRTLVRATASEQEFRVECGKGDSKHVSEVHVVAVDSEHVKMSTTTTSSKGAKQLDFSATAETRWIGEDCKGED